MGKDWYPNCWLDQEWRLNHMYYILSKEKGIVRFQMNWAQSELYKELHNRNNILKARQLGMSTFTSILILDLCIHNKNFRAGIIDKGLDDAKEKLKKIKLAFALLGEPPSYADDPVEDEKDRKAIAMWSKGLVQELESKKATEWDDDNKKNRGTLLHADSVRFSNGSEIRVGTSLRGGTLDFLHVSEFGWVANNNPLKAQEILSGGVEAVPLNGCVIMESTHEGARSGANYQILKGAMENIGKHHSPQDYKFFFFPWYKQQEYRVEGRDPVVNTVQDEYFLTLKQNGIELDDEQKRWYLAKAKVLGHRVKTEYPTTPEEAFLAQVEGAIYGSIIAHLRAEGKIGCRVPSDPYKPLYVSWDIGMNDNMSIWLIQPQSDGSYYALDYYSCSDKVLSHFLMICQDWEREHGQRISMHLLPHDANHRTPISTVTFAMHFWNAKLPAVVLPRISDVWQGIHETKMILKYFAFHEKCSRMLKVDGIEILSGVDCLENYRKASAGAGGALREIPLHDETSHGADAFRMFAEAVAAGYVNKNLQSRKEVYGEVGIKKKKSVKSKGVPSYW